MSRYGSPQYVLDLPIDYGIEVILKAFEERYMGRKWELYLTVFPNMTSSNFVSFDDFIARDAKPAVVESEKSETDILGDVEWILHSLRGDEHGDI